MKRALLIATRSAGKLHELRPLLASRGLLGESLEDAGIVEHTQESMLEAFDSFEANALAKARWFSGIAPGRIVLADDSGLMVDSLCGAPGVLSKRWSNRPDLAGHALDRENNQTLLNALAQVAARGDERRSAGYVCAAACCWNGVELVARGETRGSIVGKARGSGGFGYDPYFFSDYLARCFGEVSLEEKSRVSHRGRAFGALFDLLRRSGALSGVNFAIPVDHAGEPG